MSKTKVLNLYAGIGGNRKLWTDVDVTAVEINPKIADHYGSLFENDTVVVGDAHEYLKEHHNDGWDFIWTSPPCQTHSKMSRMTWQSDKAQNKNREPQYPDMRLYQEILFLQNFVDCDYVVENVNGYYDPLIPCQEVARHYIWSNFHVPDFETPRMGMFDTGTRARLEKEYGYDLDGVDLGHRKDQVIRNCVHPKLGKHIFESRTTQDTLPGVEL